jgi:CheY-like chemotaxis protein
MTGKILIVDDEAANLKLLEILLAPEGYKIMTAKSGEECLEMLKTEKIDMVLLDIMMPGISGYDVLKRVRKDEHLRILPVIFLTALDEKKDRIKGIELGADDFISKPFDSKELLARVRSQLKLSFLRRQLAEKERLIKIINEMNDGVIITKKDFKPLIINRYAGELLEIKDKSNDIFSYIKRQYAITFKRFGVKIEFLLKRPETDKFKSLYISVSMYPVKNLQNETDSYVFLFKDVTEKCLENKLQYDFLSMISHKLNTPITAINGLVDMLKFANKNTKLDHIINSIDGQKERLKILISRLLYFINMEEEDLSKEVEKEDIMMFIDLLRCKYEISDLELEKNIRVDCIPYYQKIICQELLDNAFKFFAGDKLKIKLGMDKDEIYVTDNGSGIPPEERGKIFEPFYQIEKYFTGQIPGAGLGLTFVKRLTELFKGKINIETKLYSGTSFHLSFPK